jgi:hypothetical protein
MFLVPFLNGLGHMEEKGRFSGTGRGDNEPSLAPADGCHKVHETGGVAIRSRLKSDLFAGIDGLEFFKGRKFACLVRFLAINEGRLNHLWATGAVAGDPLDPDAWTDSVLPDQIWRDKHVLFSLLKVLFLLSQKSKSLGSNLKESVDRGRFSGEFEGFAFPWFAVVPVVVARSESADPSLSLAAIAVSIAVPVSIPVSIVVAVAGVGGLLAAGVR